MSRGRLAAMVALVAAFLVPVAIGVLLRLAGLRHTGAHMLAEAVGAGAWTGLAVYVALLVSGYRAARWRSTAAWEAEAMRCYRRGLEQGRLEGQREGRPS